jgi:hypothetical protein
MTDTQFRIRIKTFPELRWIIPNAKINFRNGKGTEMEGGRKPDESGERNSHSFGEKKNALVLGSRVLLI